MANPYPAVFQVSSVLTIRLDGLITFTDPANQPGGGGGGGVNSVTAGDASITVAGTVVDPTVAVAAFGITSGKIAPLAVTASKIAGAAVDVSKMSSGAAAAGTVATADGVGGVSYDAPAGVATLSAADTSLIVGGTPTAPTVRTATLDVIAATHPPAAAWSNNGQKITGIADGVAASDAAAFGQIPTALPPNGAASGDLAGFFPGPTVAAINGVAIMNPAGAGLFLVAADATHAAWSAVAPGGVTAVLAADASIVVSGLPASPAIATGTLDAIAAAHPPVADWDNNGKKITGLADGVAASDAAAFGQIPTALPPNGAASGDLAGSYPSPTLAISGVTAGTYGDSTHVAQVTVDAKGRATAAAAVAIAFPTALTADNQAGTTYTLALADAGQVVELNNGSPITLTIPTNASVAFPVGTVIQIWQQGAGQVTVAPAGGVTLRSPGARTKLAVQYAAAVLRQRATDEWTLEGDITT